jgi:D-3-phosphoglycerate dehydrogenase
MSDDAAAAGKFRILVTERLGDEGITILESAPDVKLDIRVGLSRDDLLKALPQYDAIITRSGTHIDKDAIDAGSRLKVIARAGVGVDNVDIQEASRRGIVVINAPTGNTLAAAEQTMALILSVMRKIPQAHNSLVSGEWSRSRFNGRQLNGKKILIMGLGRIGIQVAIRCRAFGMEIMGYDPYVHDKKMLEVGIQRVTDLAGALSLADIVTVHLPITSETHELLGERALRSMKPGSFLINCARGGIIDEAACAQALRDGRLAGAAFDVYTQEPPSASNPLFDSDIADKVVLTPHIAASTVEAQTEVALIAASNTLYALRGEPYDHAVNLPFLEQHLGDIQRNYVMLARKMGVIMAKLIGNDAGPALRCRVTLRGSALCDEDAPRNKKSPYTVAFIKGFLEVTHGPEANYMIAPLLAAERGIAIEESTGESETYKNLVEATVECQGASMTITGTITEEGRQHIVKVNDYWLDFVPRGQLLVFQNHDRPGVIGKIGGFLGDSNVNIANFTLGRKNASGLALAVMEVDGLVSDDLISLIERDGDLIWATTVNLDGGSQR